MAERIMVSVCCITYNQEKYIANALDSFLNQKTNFRYEIIIHDDASTDGTVDIIKKYKKKYPDKIITIFEKENQYSKNHNSVLNIVFSRARGKYIALCEGDDGFCNSDKLQLQFDIINNNSSISLVSHNNKVIDDNCNFIEDSVPYSKHKITERDFLNNYYNSMHTSSMMFRKRDVINLPEYFNNALVGDLPLKMYLLSIGNCYHINKIMSFYRIGSIGSWSLSQKKDKSKLLNNFLGEIDIYNSFNKETKYTYDCEIKNRILNKKFNFYKDNGNLKEIKKVEYKDLYNKISFKEKIKLYLKSNKIIYNVYLKLKYGKRC